MSKRGRIDNTRLLLYDQLEEGYGLPEAAQRIGINRRSAYRRHANVDPGLPRTRRSKLRFILPLYLAGHTLTEIGALLQLPHSVVLNRINPAIPLPKASILLTPKPKLVVRK